MSKTLFNETNKAAIAVSSYWAINLQEKLKQDRALEDLPANAFYTTPKKTYIFPKNKRDWGVAG